MPAQLTSLAQAARLIDGFGMGSKLTVRIAGLEEDGRGRTGCEIAELLAVENVGEELLTGARTVKAMAGQINVVIHAVGILISLPHILEKGEVVESLSLGAGNTGRDHDLETDRRIAEFKFIDWRGGSETIRQNNVFADVFNLATTETTKRRVLYVLGTEHPLKFLRGGRAMTSVLSRSSKVRRLFHDAYGADMYSRVGDYWKGVESIVEIGDLRELVPAFAPQPAVTGD